MNKLLSPGIVIAGCLAVVSMIMLNRNQPSDPAVHYHAGFRVYDNGVLQNFEDDKYMHFALCTADGEYHDTDPEKEKAHLHDSVGDVVHVHRTGSVWQDLFTNIGYTPEGSGVVAYVNGQPVADPLARPIREEESIIFVFGGNDNEDPPSGYVTVERIREVAGKSESCGS